MPLSSSPPRDFQRSLRMFIRALRSVIQPPVSRTIVSSQSPLFKSFPDLHGCHLLSITTFLGNRNVPAANVAFHGAGGLRGGRPAGTLRGRDVKNRTKQQHRAIVVSERNKVKAKVEKANTRFEKEKRGGAGKWLRICGKYRLQVLRVFGELEAELKAAGMTFKDLESLKATGVTWQSWMRERHIQKRKQSQSSYIQKEEQSQSSGWRRQTKRCTRGRGLGQGGTN